MAVQFSSAATRPSTVANIYTQLHQTLIAAGWELVYADADAIGTGGASSPAWSKTPAVSTTAGMAIYRMPLVSGYPTRWCIEVKPFWTSPSTLHGVTVRVGDGVSGATLLNPGSTITVGPGGTSSGSNSAGTEWYVNAYEHGLLVALHGTSGSSAGFLLCLERRRRLDGTVLDDLNTYVCATASYSSSAQIGSFGSAYQGGSMSRVAGVGQYDPQRWVVLADSSNQPPYTLNRMDGGTGVMQGPLNVSGGLGGLPRLFQVGVTNDLTPGVDATVNVDGADRAYHVATAGTALFATGALQTRVAYAKE